MTDYNHFNHTTWDCKRHVVPIPEYRKKILFGQLRKRLGRGYARRESKIEIAAYKAKRQTALSGSHSASRLCRG
ncbi:MAG: hypothetical protein KGI29_10480 [Pseudomonadota bacterium]|nr:hypothetical protein [Pseudomonadota bacterium]MDE3037412.1 hypothetical protein [Pseudomonadota bacterium]